MSSLFCCVKNCNAKNNVRTFFASQQVAEQFQLCLTRNQMDKLLTSSLIPVQLCWTHFNDVMSKKAKRDTQSAVPKNVTVTSSIDHQAPQPNNEVVIDLVNHKEDDLSTNIGILHNYSKSPPSIKLNVINKENQPDVDSVLKTKSNLTSNIRSKFSKFVPNIIRDAQKSVQAEELEIKLDGSTEPLIKSDDPTKTLTVQKTIGKVSMVSPLKSKYLESKAKVLVDAQGTRFKVVKLNDYQKVRHIKMRPSEKNSLHIFGNLDKKRESKNTSDIVLNENTSEIVLNVNTCERVPDQPEEVIVEKPSSDLCRICANSVANDTLLNIFDEFNSTRVEKIEKCLPDKVTKENGLPTKICEVCWKKIEDFVEFIDTFNRADMWLRTMLKKKEPSTESVVDLTE